jgi:hypothetical protein
MFAKLQALVHRLTAEAGRQGIENALASLRVLKGLRHEYHKVRLASVSSLSLI